MNLDTLELSKHKDKKFKIVTPKGKTIHFGDKRYEHYSNAQLPNIYRNIYRTHNDPFRQIDYLRRAMGIKNKRGKYTHDDPESANYYSIRLLWL
jgi:hypothetical protein